MPLGPLEVRSKSQSRYVWRVLVKCQFAEHRVDTKFQLCWWFQPDVIFSCHTCIGGTASISTTCIYRRGSVLTSKDRMLFPRCRDIYHQALLPSVHVRALIEYEKKVGQGNYEIVTSALMNVPETMRF